MQPVIEVRDVVKDYEAGGTLRRALGGVSLSVEPGSFLAVMGPSGSGKSTLLHLMGGLDQPTSGEVLLDGRALSGMGDDELTVTRRDRVGFVFQFFNLVPVLTLEENVALPAVVAGRPRDEWQPRVSRLLELVGLTGHARQLPSEVSGGQQQRAAVARAMLLEPAVLLADEPTGNLDSATGREVLGLVRDARDETGQTVVLVTHDPAAAAVADEVVLLRDGLLEGRHGLEGTEGRRSRQVVTLLRGPDAAPRRRRAARA